MLTVVFGSHSSYNLSFFTYNSSFSLAIELLCLQWDSVSKQHLNGL